MTPAFAMRPVTAQTRPVLERLWQLYRHDLSEFRDSRPAEDGTFPLRTLLPFLGDDADRAAYLFSSGASPVGFALISGLTAERRLMSEFFVVRSARRQGIASAAVAELFALHPGTWEIPFQENNVAAARFWRSAVRGAGREELRPVPGKPEIPPDVWITLSSG